jgi:hypothetical protein
MTEIVDTGASVTCIVFKAETERASIAASFLGVADLRIGESHLRNFPIFVGDLPADAYPDAALAKAAQIQIRAADAVCHFVGKTEWVRLMWRTETEWKRLNRPPKGGYTIRRFAVVVDLPEGRVRRAVELGELAAVKFGGVVRIPPREVDRIRKLME